MTNVVAAEKGSYRHCTESIAENQPLEIPSVNDPFVISKVTEFYNHLYGLSMVECTLLYSTMMRVLIMPCKSLKYFSHVNSSLVVVNPSLLQQKNS